jgi:hypothetical protein
MSITRATGSQISIGSTIGSNVVMSAITNATEAVATLASGHGVVVGDILKIASGWDLLNGKLVRAKAVASNDVTLEGVDTSSTTNYPAGTGAGTINRVTAFTNLSQLTSGMNVSGGDQNFADITTLSDQIKKQMPIDRNPVVVTLPFYDDPSLPWYAAVVAASDSATITPFRMVFPNGSKLYANGYWSIRKVPTIEDSTLRGEITVSFSSEPTRYAS